MRGVFEAVGRNAVNAGYCAAMPSRLVARGNQPVVADRPRHAAQNEGRSRAEIEDRRRRERNTMAALSGERATGAAEIALTLRSRRR